MRDLLIGDTASWRGFSADVFSVEPERSSRHAHLKRHSAPCSDQASIAKGGTEQIGIISEDDHGQAVWRIYGLVSKPFGKIRQEGKR